MMVVRTCWIVGVAELTVAECMKLCFPRHQDDTYYSDSFVHFCHKKVDNLFVVRVVQQELDLQAHRLDLEAQEVGVALVVQA